LGYREAPPINPAPGRTNIQATNALRVADSVISTELTLVCFWSMLGITLTAMMLTAGLLPTV
jgi:hypothetical protein